MDQANQAEQSHVLDIGIASLTQQLERDMNALRTSTMQLSGGSPPHLIIRKDASLTFTRNVDKFEYDPHYVSIGPYHWSRSDSSSLARKADKIRCLEAVLGDSSTSTSVLEGIIRELEGVEGFARSWYRDDFQDMTRPEFVRMLLLDGCYILARFGRVNVSDGEGAPTADGEGAPVADGEGAPTADGEGAPVADGEGAPVANREGAPVADGEGAPMADREGAPMADGEGAPMADGEGAPVAAAGGDTDRLENVLVVRDVFYLVENQIPYFVIEKILSKTGENNYAASNIAAYVRDLLEGHKYVAATPKDVALTEPRRLLTESRHLLHLLHLHLKPSIDFVSATGGTTDPSVGRWRTATEYDFAGVKLKKRAFSTEEARCILDVTLDRRGGTLHVPCLNIDMETWRILRNLTALEQHNPVVGSHVTAYCVFMSQVACNAQDVELLSKEGIIVHQMGNHGEVADHFANLCKGVVFDANVPRCNYLRETCQTLEKRFRSRRGRWMAWLWRKYFSNPWLVVGLVAAAIGLACAVVQAVNSF